MHGAFLLWLFSMSCIFQAGIFGNDHYSTRTESSHNNRGWSWAAVSLWGQQCTWSHRYEEASLMACCPTRMDHCGFFMNSWTVAGRPSQRQRSSVTCPPGPWPFLCQIWLSVASLFVIMTLLEGREHMSAVASRAIKGCLLFKTKIDTKTNK